jgi:hypothetical protein
MIEINMFGYKTLLKIIKLPIGNVSKKDVLDYYELIERISVLIG